MFSWFFCSEAFNFFSFPFVYIYSYFLWGYMMLWAEAANRDQSTDPQYLEGEVLFSYPGSCKLLLRWVHSHLTWGWGRRWVTTTVLRAEISQFVIQAFPWKLQAFDRLQNSKWFCQFCQCKCCLYGKADSCFLLHQLSRIPWNLFYLFNYFLTLAMLDLHCCVGLLQLQWAGATLHLPLQYTGLIAVASLVEQRL